MLVQPKLKNERLAGLAVEVRYHIYSSLKLMYPVVYSDKMAHYRKLKDIPFDLLLKMPNVKKNQRQNYSSDSEKQTVHSGVIDALNTLIKEIQVDAKLVYNPKFTSSRKLNKLIEQDIENYHEKRVGRYFKRLQQHIEALIALDDYDIDLFGEYHMVVRQFEESQDRSFRQEYLDEMILIGLSVIPYSMKKEQTVNIEASIVSPVKMT